MIEKSDEEDVLVLSAELIVDKIADTFEHLAHRWGLGIEYYPIEQLWRGGVKNRTSSISFNTTLVDEAKGIFKKMDSLKNKS